MSSSAELDDAPQTGCEYDSKTIVNVEPWIRSGHPDKCVPRLTALLNQKKVRYETTKQCLVAHCIQEHNAGLPELVKMFAHSFVLGEDQTGLSSSIMASQSRLTEQVISCGSNNESAFAVNLIARHIDADHFAKLWKAVWENGLASQAPTLAASVFRASAFSKTQNSFALRVIKKEADRVFKIIPNDLVFCLVMSQELRTARDETLELLLSQYKSDAAKIIISMSEPAKEIPRCVSAATRELMQKVSDDPMVPVGIGLCLQVDSNFAIQTIVCWTNQCHSSHYFNQSLRYLIDSSDQTALFKALASDAIARNPVWHKTLGERHHELITNIEPVIQWIYATLGDQKASRYNAALIVSYLSEPRGTDSDKIQKLVEYSHLLHQKFGTRDEKIIREESHLTDSSLKDYEILVAIVIAKDVVYEPKQVDTKYALAIIKALPFTYKALGEGQLDADVTNGILPPFIHNYADDLESELLALQGKVKNGKIEPWAADWLKSGILHDSQFRKNWETRFEKIVQSGVAIPTDRLRTDSNVWVEMRMLALLVDQFRVVYEPPGIPRMDTKRPDFLLESPDGTLMLEVAAVNAKPEDVREGAKVSTGGILKKTLQNKLHDKFNDCQNKYSMPIVISVETRLRKADEFDTLNSLYGPQQFTLVTEKQSGVPIVEGTKRETEKAFFNEATKCISAVATFAPESSAILFLEGKIHRPIEVPTNPIAPKLWLRLRNALFGPTPKNLLDEISRIPGILGKETQELLDHGVDDLSFFAAGRISYPENMVMEQKRFEELRQQAERLILLCQTGQITYLPSAQKINLSIFQQCGIYTLNGLLQTQVRPPVIDEKAWNTLRNEAAAVLERGDSSSSAN